MNFLLTHESKKAAGEIPEKTFAEISKEAPGGIPDGTCNERRLQIRVLSRLPCYVWAFSAYKEWSRCGWGWNWKEFISLNLVWRRRDNDIHVFESVIADTRNTCMGTCCVGKFIWARVGLLVKFVFQIFQRCGVDNSNTTIIFVHYSVGTKYSLAYFFGENDTIFLNVKVFELFN